MKKTILIVQHGKDAPVYCETFQDVIDYLTQFADFQPAMITPIETYKNE